MKQPNKHNVIRDAIALPALNLLSELLIRAIKDAAMRPRTRMQELIQNDAIRWLYAEGDGPWTCHWALSHLSNYPEALRLEILRKVQHVTRNEPLPPIPPVLPRLRRRKFSIVDYSLSTLQEPE